MSTSRIAQLEELLARVQVRAREPRRAAVGLEATFDATEAVTTTADLSKAGLLEARAAAVETAPKSLDFEEIDDLSDVEEVDGVDIDVEEPGPASGVDRVAASSMEQALASAVDHPPITPPPASVEQLTPAPPLVAASPSASPRLSASPIRPSGAPVRPTMEQLGETVALDEGPSREFELDRPASPGSSPLASEAGLSSSHHLEEHLAPVGIVDHKNLTSPPEAREELERMRLGQVATLEAEVVQRPQISTNVVDFVGAHQSFMPETFAELLDASLGL